MQRGRDGRDNFFGDFGDQFGGFPGFGGSPFGGSMISNMLGGRDPFDDPFFTQPFGGMMGSNMFGSSIFGTSMFGPNRGGFLGGNVNSFENRAPLPTATSNGPVIQEISSDDEEENEVENNSATEKRENPRKHSRSRKEPYVQDPDDEIDESRSRSVQLRRERANTMHPQSRTFSYQSSTVTYGGVNGAYYTASKTRKMGGDGVVFEESKEADSTTGKATHEISRGIHDKGHTLTRKLNSDGRVDSLQTLHNLNEDELAGFNEKWKGKARENLPGYNPSYEMLNSGHGSGDGREMHNNKAQRGWALPSTVSKKHDNA